MYRLFKWARKKKTSPKRLCSISTRNGLDSDENFQQMMETMRQILRHTPSDQVIFLCIGSSRSVGDSLGPLVGTMLKEKNIPFHVYGTMKEPIHALNLEDVLKEIQQMFAAPLIIPIDASLGDSRQVGDIYLIEGPLTPGKAIDQALPPLGGHHIRAVVNKLDPLSPVQSLRSADKDEILLLAKVIADIVGSIEAEKIS